MTNWDPLEECIRMALAIHWVVEQLEDHHTSTCHNVYKNHKHLRYHLGQFDGTSCLAI